MVLKYFLDKDTHTAKYDLSSACIWLSTWFLFPVNYFGNVSITISGCLLQSCILKFTSLRDSDFPITPFNGTGQILACSATGLCINIGV